MKEFKNEAHCKQGEGILTIVLHCEIAGVHQVVTVVYEILKKLLEWTLSCSVHFVAGEGSKHL